MQELNYATAFNTDLAAPHTDLAAPHTEAGAGAEAEAGAGAGLVALLWLYNQATSSAGRVHRTQGERSSTGGKDRPPPSNTLGSTVHIQLYTFNCTHCSNRQVSIKHNTPHQR